MDITKLKSNVVICLKSGLVPFIQGSPGLGKSAIVREIAEENNLKLIDVRLSQCDIADLNGLPKLDGKKATFLPFDLFPIEGDEIPAGKAGWLLFLDELNSANRAVQAASYKLILDRMIGNHKLHDKVAVVSAGNLITDNAVVNQLSTALRSRLINFTVEPDVQAWISWAMTHGIDSRILAYISYKNEHLFTFDPEKDDETYACPRTWEMLNKLLKNVHGNLKDYKELVNGTIGSIGNMFIEYTKYAKHLPKFNDIKSGKATLPQQRDLGLSWMIVFHCIEHVDEITTDAECNNTLTYIIGLGKDLAGMFIAQCREHKANLFNFPSFFTKLHEVVM